MTEACGLARRAALMSASFGRFQIMGFNHASCGYVEVEEFVAAMNSEGRQLAAFIEFIKARDLDDELQRRDWAGFARGYNGKAYAVNQYDLKLKRAYEKFANERKS
jgi:N-acetylmuramidase